MRCLSMSMLCAIAARSARAASRLAARSFSAWRWRSSSASCLTLSSSSLARLMRSAVAIASARCWGRGSTQQSKISHTRANCPHLLLSADASFILLLLLFSTFSLALLPKISL